MKLRILVALVAAFTLGATACSKDDKAPAEAAAGAPADPKAEAAAPTEAAPPEAAPTEAAPTEAAPTEAAPTEADANDPMKRALELQKKALDILKANKTDAKAAAAALEAFQKENEASIEALKKDLGEMAEKMKDHPEKAMELMQKYAAEIQEMTKVTMDLMNEAPELMGSPEVAAAMAKMSPSPDDDAGQDNGGSVTDEPAGDEAIPAAKLTDEEKASLEQAVVAQEKMLDLLAENGADPDKAGAALLKYVEDNKASLTAMVAVQKKLQGDQAAAMEFAQKNMARITAIATKLTELMQKYPNLMTNEKVMSAMSKMNGAE